MTIRLELSELEATLIANALQTRMDEEFHYAHHCEDEDMRNGASAIVEVCHSIMACIDKQM